MMLALLRSLRRSSVFAWLAAGVFVLPGWARADDSPLANATILVIRHAEKPKQGRELTAEGYARAKAYVKYFRALRIDDQPIHIDHIFATTDSKKSMRCRLTVEPLAASLHQKVDVRFANEDYEAFVEELRHHRYGKTLVVCWHHGKIPALLKTLGAPDGLIPGDKWPDGTFDWMVNLKFDASGKPIAEKATVVHEHLMPTDAP